MSVYVCNSAVVVQVFFFFASFSKPKKLAPIDHNIIIMMASVCYSCDSVCVFLSKFCVTHETHNTHIQKRAKWITPSSSPFICMITLFDEVGLCVCVMMMMMMSQSDSESVYLNQVSSSSNLSSSSPLSNILCVNVCLVYV